ncbi:SusC/RagA family TonB-linked outer membrane protein [Mucilaginibacter yixingensis]|nr:TonB-dependent receptor [Mucilaginibacter yixingensis]
MLLFALLLMSGLTFAQTGSITGKVVDEHQQPLPGATVVLQGSTIGTTTDANGVFRISNVKRGTYNLVASFISYNSLTKSVTLSGATVAVDFDLQPASKALNEIVVIGYGTVRKTDLTGSVANVTAKDFNQGANTTPEQLIQGKVPGVSIISNSGAPGSGSTIRIRGGASISGSNNPLIVIDGVPIDNTRNPDGTSRISGVADPLSLINPNDIESFSILKDASAAAIYGNRASNGVIIITTKKGQSGKPVITFSAQASMSKLPKEASVLSASQFRSFVAAHDSSGFYTKFLGNANTDWQKEIYQTAYSTDDNVGVSGTTGILPYRVSVGFTDQNGILKTSSLQRNTANINLSPSLFDKHLKINFNASGAHVHQRFANESAISSAVFMNPTVPVYSGNSNYGGYWQWLDPNNSPTYLKLNTPKNPVGLLNQEDNRSDVYRLISNLQLDYRFHFLPDLHANVNFAYDGTRGQGHDNISDSSATNYRKSYLDSNKVYHGGKRSIYKQTSANKLFEGYLSYDKQIKSINSHINVIAGYSYQDVAVTVFNYPGYFYDGAQTPNSTPNYAYSLDENKLQSYYGRLIYSYADKYLLTATIRRDGSSKFDKSGRYGTFPSVALGWKISEEDFLKNNPVLSNLKLRVEYGVTGNQDGIGNYDYLADYTLSGKTGSYQLGNTYYQGYRPSPYYPGRTWEQTATANVGFDYGFLEDRITGSIDYFHRKTTHLLAVINQPAGTNFSNQITGNVGDMTNSGVEFSINGQVIKQQDLSWNVGFNVTYNRNKVTSLPGVSYPGIADGAISGGTGSKIETSFTGYPVHSFYVLQQVYNAAGQPIENLFVDRNGDGTINASDLYFYKSPDPKFYFGFSSDVNYKKWNAGFVARANLGNYAYNNIASNAGVVASMLQSVSGGFVNNGSTAVLKSNLTGNTSNDRLSDYYIENASFLRMDNVHIGYNVGKLFNGSADLKISANVNNVFLITKYSGVDPEIANGVDNNFYPRPRTFVLGLNLSVR